MKRLCLIILFLLGSNAYALTLDRVNLFGEDIKECGLSSESVTASLASLMRYNRISMTDSLSGVNLYHQVTAIDTGNGCAAHASILFYSYQTNIFVPTLKRSLSADVVLCNKSALLTGPKHSLQTRVNNEIKSLAEQCLLIIDKK